MLIIEIGSTAGSSKKIDFFPYRQLNTGGFLPTVMWATAVLFSLKIPGISDPL